LDNKLNVLHWPTAYPDPSRGMPYHCIFVEEHIKSLQPFVNNRMLFISPESTLSNKWVERTDSNESGIIVTRFYFNRKLNLQFLNLYIRLIIFFYFLELILIKKYRPQIIHMHFSQNSPWVIPFAKLFKIPFIITEHWSAFLGWPNIGMARYKNAGKSFEACNYVLPVSNSLLNGIEKFTGANVKSKSEVIFNCVDVNMFNYEALVIEEKITFIGRNAEEKDLPTLLIAFKKVLDWLPKFKLEIIGSGDFYDINKIASELNINNNIILSGGLNKNEIAKKLKHSQLLVLSSFIENSPCVIGEAHCCGLPVVATDVGAVKELIMEGGVVPPKSPELLAEKILEQLDKKTDRMALAQRAQTRFSYDAIGQQIFEVYQNVCAE